MTILSDVATGKKVRLVQVRGGRALSRRLRALGLTPGTELEVLHHRGRSVVVGREGNRVALGGAVAEQLLTEVID